MNRQKMHLKHGLRSYQTKSEHCSTTSSSVRSVMYPFVKHLLIKFYICCDYLGFQGCDVSGGGLLCCDHV